MMETEEPHLPLQEKCGALDFWQKSWSLPLVSGILCENEGIEKESSPIIYSFR